MQPSNTSFVLKPKPKFSFELKQEPEQAFMEKRIESYYRYHMISLIKGCKKNCYEEKSGSKQLGHRRSMGLEHKNLEQGVMVNLNKQTLTKSKYRHRQRINFYRCQALKALKYNFEALKQKIGSKQHQELYEDLEDGDKKDEQKRFYKDSNFNEQLFKNYKKRNNISQNQKIFIISNYKDLTKYFLQQGWFQNPDIDSLVYDFKFITKARHIDYTNIRDSQITNHFEKGNCLTTKFGLCRNLKNLILFSQDPDEFYPRCYDLYDMAEFEDWIQQFKWSKLIALLKSCLEVSEEQLLKNRKLIGLCIQCGKRMGMTVHQKIVQIQNNRYPVITPEQWNYISNPSSIPQKFQEYFSIESVKRLLQDIKIADIQYNINKENIWIVKPGSKSRGRGIKAFSDLKEIINYVAGKEDVSWVVQKYLQNPLIIKNRKFDIRQWVVITDFKPLRIWAYKQCYVRFSAEEYSPSNIKNRFSHLTNNSVAKYSQNFDNDQIKGNMYFQEELATTVEQLTGKDCFSLIKDRMYQIMCKSIQSVSDMIVPRKNTLEIFGYDFMIDTEMKPWLIEVNSSPSMQHSTHVTQKLVPQALRGFGQIVNQYMLGGKQTKEVIGGWKLIYNK